MSYAVPLLLVVVMFIGIDAAYAQETIILNETQPCFLDYTAGAQMWQLCNLDEDWIDFSLMGFNWVSGGYLPMIVVSVFIGISYVKYHKAIYPLLIGIMFTPIAIAFFPDTFLTWALLMAGAVVFILIWYTFIKQTKEY